MLKESIDMKISTRNEIENMLLPYKIKKSKVLEKVKSQIKDEFYSIISKEVKRNVRAGKDILHEIMEELEARDFEIKYRDMENFGIINIKYTIYWRNKD